MAFARPLPSLWQGLFPAVNGPVRPVVNVPLLQRLSQSFQSIPTPFAALAIPSLSLPSIPSLTDIWEGVLKAVPKKKMSYRKKRQRFLVGKGLKELTSLNKCPGCGRVKRAHMLCPYCVHAIKTQFFGIDPTLKTPAKKQLRQEKREQIEKRRRERQAEPHPDDRKSILGPHKWKP
ncbi:hypothetical protein CC78DRAFT_614900 [Lojkania enalia]|uniref:Large ribosomal subunit protein bL32m n=1 Tax=Lojkania enalia TaxID=147567 RepID=A0A9P4KHT7_9PLEO|nr:hypothetical protein CC78DRAFT_614900 [Didymosphaeria enalia]